MKVTTLLLLFVSTLAAGEDRLTAIRQARSYTDLEPLVRALETDLPEGAEGFEALKVAARALTAFDRVDEARALLLRQRARVGEDHESAIHGLVADLLEGAGRLDDAIAAARQAVKSVKADRRPGSGDGYTQRVRLARLLQKKGDWSGALTQWRAAVPSSTCGTCAGAMDCERQAGILRCRFWLGEREEALTGLAKLVGDRDAHLGSGGAHWGLYLELSARAGQLDRARRRLARLSDREKKRHSRVLAIVTGFAEKNPKTIVDAMEGRPETRENELAVRLFGELGAPAVKSLEKPIVSGDANSIRFAGIAGLSSLLPALKSRLAIEADRKRKSLLEWAIRQLSR
jgi:hypothetical protein